MPPRRAEGVMYDEVDGKAVLIDAAGTCVIELNAVGSVVWGAIDGVRDVPDLVGVVQSRVDQADSIPYARFEADIQAFVAELTKLELLQP